MFPIKEDSRDMTTKRSNWPQTGSFPESNAIKTITESTDKAVDTAVLHSLSW